MTVLLQRILATAALSALVGLAAIGVVRSATPASVSAGPAPAGASAAGAVVPPEGDPALTAELDAILASDTTSASPDRAAGRGVLRHLAAAARLVHATVLVDLKEGGLTTVQLDHGTISAVSATSLTIAETGGTSVTVTLETGTRVRRDGARATVAALKTGDDVFAMSKVEAGGTGAYLVVVPRR